MNPPTPHSATLDHPLVQRILHATEVVFGCSSLEAEVRQVCTEFQRDLENIHGGRGIQALLIAIVGAKSQGKTWIARQLVLNEPLRQRLRSGDLEEDATTRLVWIGPVPPEGLDSAHEIYLPCEASDMVELGQPFVLLDTPGVTDVDQRAAQLARQSLSLAPIKLLAIARDQIRAAANLQLARQIEGALCLPIITSVEADELDGAELQADLRVLKDRLKQLAPNTQLLDWLLIPDFEISGDEAAAGAAVRAGLIERLSDPDLLQGQLASSTPLRVQAASDRLKSRVSNLISHQLPQLAEAVRQLDREIELVPSRALDSLLGNQSILETGLRMRLRAQLANDTSLLCFPYRTLLSLLNLTQGAWDRVVLALSGSVPSLFGSLTAWARNARLSHDFAGEVNQGVRRRIEQQVEEHLRPLSNRFNSAVKRLRPDADHGDPSSPATANFQLLGVEEFQTRSRTIFEEKIQHSATPGWLVQLLGLGGTGLFWALMAAPIFELYKEYFDATRAVWMGAEARLENFPSPSPSLFLTSLILSLLPLMVYCMIVLTVTLNRRRIARIALQVEVEHQRAITELQEAKIIRIHFHDDLLEQAKFLLNLSR